MGQTLTVVHPPVLPETLAGARPAHHQISHHGAEAPGSPRILSTSHEYFVAGQAQGHAVVVVVVVCVGLLLTVLSVGLARLRAAHKRSLREEQEVEMAWDDAALNITVNPMEETGSCGGRPHSGAKALEESDVGDDSSDEELYEAESSDEDEAPNRHRLEWDNDL